jgi:hypothetical protein
MKALKFIIGSIAAGLAAAFLGGAVWAHNAHIDPDRYIVSNDVITAAGAVGGALFLILAARLFYVGLRPERKQYSPTEASRSHRAAPTA